MDCIYIELFSYGQPKELWQFCTDVQSLILLWIVLCSVMETNNHAQTKEKAGKWSRPRWSISSQHSVAAPLSCSLRGSVWSHPFSVFFLNIYCRGSGHTNVFSNNIRLVDSSGNLRMFVSSHTFSPPRLERAGLLSMVLNLFLPPICLHRWQHVAVKDQREKHGGRKWRRPEQLLWISI